MTTPPQNPPVCAVLDQHLGPRIVKYWPRRLSELEMYIVTSWPALSERKPEPGQLCRFILIHPDWCSGDKIEEGRYHEPPAPSIGRFGGFVGDPQYLYWSAS